MKNLFTVSVLCVALVLSGCGASNQTKGTGIGGGTGAAIGAGIGALLNGGKGAAWGAGIGAVVGGTAGNLIGKKMDKQKAELDQINGAQVETVNDGQAIKVTFDSGILFATNSSTLSASSKTALTQFAASLKSNPDTNVDIIGYTDNTGGDKINVPLSEQRAASVKAYLTTQGVGTMRLTAEGLGSAQPVADNGTAAGRQQNRRVEVYISANEKMLQEAQAGTLK
jgi:outer membrane protein OmpA-like peptidoglycan-associated protein